MRPLYIFMYCTRSVHQLKNNWMAKTQQHQKHQYPTSCWIEKKILDFIEKRCCLAIAFKLANEAQYKYYVKLFKKDRGIYFDDPILTNYDDVTNKWSKLNRDEATSAFLRNQKGYKPKTMAKINIPTTLIKYSTMGDNRNRFIIAIWQIQKKI